MQQNQCVDVFIAGCGAAGLTAALYAARLGLSAVACGTVSGGQLSEVAQLENFPGIAKGADGAQFFARLKEQVLDSGAKILTDTIFSIDKINGIFKIKCTDSEHYAKTVIYALGANHRRLDVPGERAFCGKGVSYCAVCDGAFFAQKDVVVVGGGDSACSEALFLSGIAKSVTVVHRRSTFRAAAALVQKLSQKQNVFFELDSIVQEICGESFVRSVRLLNVKTGSVRELAADAVFVLVGMIPATGLLEFLPKDSGGYITTDERMQTSIPGLFCAGDVRSKPLRQIVTAASDGAIAAFSAKEFIDLKFL